MDLKSLQKLTDELWSQSNPATLISLLSQIIEERYQLKHTRTWLQAILGNTLAPTETLPPWDNLQTDQRDFCDFLLSQCLKIQKTLEQQQIQRALIEQDPMTGLLNLRSFESALENELKRVQRYGSHFCLLFIDLDHFKKVNDHHGHTVGSEVLKQCAQLLKDALREVDFMGRYGGDEFVVILVESTLQAGLATADRLRNTLANHAFKLKSDEILRLTASIGLAVAPDMGQDKESLIRLADTHMYLAKSRGKNQVVSSSFDEELGNIDNLIHKTSLPLS